MLASRTYWFKYLDKVSEEMVEQLEVELDEVQQALLQILFEAVNEADPDFIYEYQLLTSEQFQFFENITGKSLDRDRFDFFFSRLS